MTSGYCKVCDRLVPIVSVAEPLPTGVIFDANRQRSWYPAQHKDASGEPCAGTKRKV